MYLQKTIFLFFILQTFIFSTTVLEVTEQDACQTLKQCQEHLKIDLLLLEKNHEKTAKTVSKIFDNEIDALNKYVDTIDMRREKLHRSIVNDYKKIGTILKAQGKPKESLKSFQKAFILSYTILGGNTLITKNILISAKKDLNSREAIEFETNALRELLKRHKKILKARPSQRYSNKVYEDYKKLIKVYEDNNEIQKTLAEYQEALNFYQMNDRVKTKIYNMNYAKLIITGVTNFNKSKKTLIIAKDNLVLLPDTPKKSRLLLQIKTLEGNNNSIFYTLFVILICLILALLYYFKIYYSPLVKKISKTPKHLFSLSPIELKKVKRDLQILLQWSDAVKLAGTTQLKVKNTLAFYAKPSIEKFVQLLEIDSYEKKNTLYLLKNINIDLNINRLFLLLTTENLSSIKETYLTGEKIFIISHPKYQDEIAAFSQNKNNSLIAATSTELSHLFLNQNSQKFLVKTLANCLSFKYLSPYQTKGAINLQNNFFGRTEIIRDITTKESSNYFLVGARQLGKSSILKELERFYKENSSVECHYFSLEHGDILQELSLALKIKKESTLEELTLTIKARKKKLIFLIDEADFLSQNTQCMQISSTFRKLSQENDAIFIFTGFWKLYQSITMNYHSPLKNFGELIHLKELEEDACQELMIKPMERLNISYEDPKVITRTIQRCGYRANLISMICDNVLKELKGNTITEKEVTNSFNKENIYTTVNEWQGLTSNEKENRINRLIVYLTFESNNFSLSDVVEKIKEKNLQLKIEEIESSLKQLNLSYVLKKEKNLYSYQIPLLKEFLLEDSKSTKISLFSIINELKNER